MSRGNLPTSVVERVQAKKYAIWMNGLAAAPRAQECYVQYKTLWDIPFSFLPEYVFESGFEIQSNNFRQMAPVPVSPTLQPRS